MTNYPILRRSSPRGGRVLVAHLGTHKTGSSYIQSAALANVDRLRAAGLTYPTPVDELGYAHHSIVGELAQAPWRRSPRLSNYMEQIEESGEDGLLSSEGLAELRWWSLTRLRLKSSLPVNAVVYFRSPARYLHSVIQEQVKHGWGTFSSDEDQFGQALETACHDPRVFPNTRISRISSRAVRAFGRSNVTLVSFDHVVESGNDIALHFFRVLLGLDLPVLDVTAADRNPRMDFTDREFNRLVNQLIRDLGVAPSTWVYRYLMAFRQWKDFSWLEKILEFRRSSVVDPVAYMREEQLTATRFGDLFATPVKEDRIFPVVGTPPDLDWCDMPALLRDCPAALADAKAIANDCLRWAAEAGIVDASSVLSTSPAKATIASASERGSREN